MSNFSKSQIDEAADKVVDEYEASREKIGSYCSAVHLICKVLLKSNAIESYSITQRTKDTQSLRNKLVKPLASGGSYIEKILKKKMDWMEIHDLAGVRIVFAFEPDMNKFIEVAQKELGQSVKVIYPDRSSGYDSIHLIIELQKERIALPEYKDFKGLMCEIQVRTILDHAWAETSHEISYKPDTAYSITTTDKTRETIDREMVKIREQYIDPAKIAINALYSFYQKIRSGAEIIDPSRLSQIESLDSNNMMHSELEYLSDSLSSHRYIIPADFDVFSLIRNCFSKARSNKVTDYNNGLYNTKGKTVFNIAEACIKIIGLVKYLDVPESIRILSAFHDLDNPFIKKRSSDTIKDIAKYNYFALKQIGLKPQKEIIDFLESNDLGEDLIKVVSAELLDPAFEGMQMQDPKTVSWMSGALPVEEGIKSIRKRTVNLLLDTYRNCESFEEKQSVIKVLGATTKLPEMGKFGEDLVAMVADDTEVLIKQYSDILFNPEGKLIADLPIAQEIESQMLRLDGLLKKKIPGAKKLVEKIRKDKKYSFFRLLAVGKFDYDDEKDFRVSELKREQEISKLFKNLNKENIAEYTVIFNDIAVYYNQKERWQWQKFSDLIITIAREKPELAEIMLDSALREKTPLVLNFATDFLLGFRKTDNYALWKKYADEIIKHDSTKLLEAIFYSFWGVRGDNFDDYARPKDIKLLGDAVSARGEFLKFNLINNNDRDLHYSLMNALVCLYEKSPRIVEAIIAREMKNHPEMMDMFLGQLDVGLIRDETSLEGWDKKNVGLILDHLIGIDNISHNVDQILLSLDPASIVNLFAKRIKRRLGMSIKTKSSSYDYVQYDAIPSYLSPELTKKLQDDPNFKAVLKLLIAEMHPNNPLYGMLLGELIKAVGGSAFREIQNEMISSGDDNQLKKVVDLMWGFGSSSVEFCFEIAKKTDNEKVLRSLESRFFSTGVVTGEYGIYSAYASKVEQIKKIMDENPDDKRVQKFGKRVIRDITLHMESEKKRVEESKILRQIEFES